MSRDLLLHCLNGSTKNLSIALLPKSLARGFWACQCDVYKDHHWKDGFGLSLDMSNQDVLIPTPLNRLQGSAACRAWIKKAPKRLPKLCEIHPPTHQHHHRHVTFRSAGTILSVLLCVGGKLWHIPQWSWLRWKLFRHVYHDKSFVYQRFKMILILAMNNRQRTGCGETMVWAWRFVLSCLNARDTTFFRITLRDCSQLIIPPRWRARLRLSPVCNERPEGSIRQTSVITTTAM